MRHAPCGYCPPLPRRSEKAPPLRRGGKPPEAAGGRRFFKLPQSALCADSPLLVEGAFAGIARPQLGMKQRARPDGCARCWFWN